MDGGPADLKAALSNVLSDLEQGPREELAKKVELALVNGRFGSPDELTASLVVLGLSALRSKLEVGQDEVRRLLELIQEPTPRTGPGRPPMNVHEAVARGTTAALVDILMREPEKRTLADASCQVAKETGKKLDAKAVRILRNNIISGNADDVTIRVYRERSGKYDNGFQPYRDPLSLATRQMVKDFWASLSERKY